MPDAASPVSPGGYPSPVSRLHGSLAVAAGAGPLAGRTPGTSVGPVPGLVRAAGPRWRV